MISLILPYWDRQEAANRALALLDEHYAYLKMEVIVVDDGNKVPFVLPPTRLDVKVVRLPVKSEPTPQSKTWNAGVKASKGTIIVLSCIEILHERNVLEPMIAELFNRGRDAYVLASAWCPEEGRWHCHSTEQIPTCPAGTGPAFLGMMYRSLFDRAGGFDEIYHDGAGYEDKDFIWRMVKAGAQFCIRDDLKVIHPKIGAQIRWKPEGFARNAKIYFDKWCQPVTFVCLKAGDMYSAEYVNILFDMVSRNLTAGFPGKFVCITDDARGIDERIEVVHLPENLPGWWGKIWMFSLFKEGEQCVFLDLDTLILGNIDALAQYRGEFATLRDFYYPERLGPAVICWKAGDQAYSIYQEWASQGRPMDGHGDLWWLNTLDQGRFAKRADRLQDLFPAMFVSYKADCHPYPPKGAKVVCFHGQPKPDNCPVEWVRDVWKIGGAGSAEIDVVANTNRETVAANVRASIKRDLPWLDLKPAHEDQIVIVAGGPSINRTLPEIQARIASGQKVMAVNGSAAWLNAQGIIPDFHVVIDAREDNARFLQSAAKMRFLASQCHPSLFDFGPATLFHLNTEGMAELIGDREAHLISSGTTVGMAAMVIAYTQGYRFIHLHGFDSSYEGEHHGYAQPENDADQRIEAMVNGRTFTCAPWMLQQVNDFQTLAVELANVGCVITVAGDGLLPYVAHCLGEI